MSLPKKKVFTKKKESNSSLELILINELNEEIKLLIPKKDFLIFNILNEISNIRTKSYFFWKCHWLYKKTISESIKTNKENEIHNSKLYSFFNSYNEQDDIIKNQHFHGLKKRSKI